MWLVLNQNHGQQMILKKKKTLLCQSGGWLFNKTTKKGIRFDWERGHRVSYSCDKEATLHSDSLALVKKQLWKPYTFLKLHLLYHHIYIETKPSRLPHPPTHILPCQASNCNPTLHIYTYLSLCLLSLYIYFDPQLHCSTLSLSFCYGSCNGLPYPPSMI